MMAVRTAESREPRAESVAQLGYLGFEVADLGAWETFASQVLGLVVARRRGDGAFSLRLDGHAQRLFVEPGRDDLAYIGWECANDADLDAVATRLTASGLKVEPGDASSCDA